MIRTEGGRLPYPLHQGQWLRSRKPGQDQGVVKRTDLCLEVPTAHGCGLAANSARNAHGIVFMKLFGKTLQDTFMSFLLGDGPEHGVVVLAVG